MGFEMGYLAPTLIGKVRGKEMSTPSNINIVADPISAIATAAAEVTKAVLQAWTVGRATMSQENRDKWDAIGPQIWDDYRNLLKTLGVLPKS